MDNLRSEWMYLSDHKRTARVRGSDGPLRVQTARRRWANDCCEPPVITERGATGCCEATDPSCSTEITSARLERIMRIRGAIADGSYRVSAGTLAQKLVQKGGLAEPREAA